MIGGQPPGMPSLAVAAARNNAAWVDAVARSHGVPTRSDGTAWRADGRMPPFYPNLVTLDPAVEPGPLLADPPRGAAAGWGLKDSFAGLDLALQGFVPAFDAVWLARTEPRASTGGASGSKTISTPTEDPPSGGFSPTRAPRLRAEPCRFGMPTDHWVLRKLA